MNDDPDRGLTVFERAVRVLGVDVATQVRDRAARRLVEKPLSVAQVELLAGLMAQGQQRPADPERQP
jgi:hypothetical protein